MKTYRTGETRKAFRRWTAGITAVIFSQTLWMPVASADVLTSSSTSVIPSFSSTFQLPGYLETLALLDGTSTAPTSGGNKYYLSADGSNSANGSQSGAWKSLSYALTKLKAGDTLYITEGTYKEDATAYLSASGTASAAIRIIGIGDVVLDGALKKASSGVYMPVIDTAGKSYIYFENLQFKNSRGIEIDNGSHDIEINGLAAADNEYAVVMRSAYNIKIRNANVTRSYFGFRADGNTHDVLMENINVSYSINPVMQSDGFQNGDGFIFEQDTYNLTFRKITSSYNADAGMDIKGDNVLIENLVSHHNTNGLKLWGANISVVNALIYDLVDQNSSAGRYTASVGINVRAGSSRIYNSTIVTTGGDSVVKPTYGASLHVENSIVALSSSSGRLYSALGTFTQKNVLWYRMGKSTPDFTIPAGSLWADPGFVNWGGKDFRLTSFSAALNRGVSNSILPSYDLAMNARLTGAAVDLGAFELAAANQPPALAVPSAQTVSENAAVSLALQGSDPEGSALTYSADNLPAGSSLNAASGLFTWTPSYDQAGSYDVTFRVSDGANQTTKLVNFLVENVNRQPVFQSLGDQTGAVGEPILFSVAANDPDGDALVLAALNLPAGAAFDAQNRIFSWTPSSGQTGDFNVAFTANDGSVLATKNVLIRVASVPTAPPSDGGTVDQVLTIDAQSYSFASGSVNTYSPGVLSMYGNRTIDYGFNAADAGEYTFRLSTAQVTTKLIPTPDYKFSVKLSVDGQLLGTYDLAADKLYTISGEMNLGMLGAGSHTLTLQWVNDTQTLTGDSNLGLRDLVISKVAPPAPSTPPAPPAPTEYVPALTVDAQQYSFVSGSVNTYSPGVLSMYGNRTITYDVNLAETGEYGFNLSTAQVTTKALPSPDYQFQMHVLVDDRLIGTFDFAADKTYTASQMLDFGMLSAGSHVVKFQWINDTQSLAGDSNLGIRDLLFSKKTPVEPVETVEPPSLVASISAHDYTASSGEVFKYSNQVLTAYGSQTIHYTITATDLDRYFVKLSTAQMTSKTVPDDYKFHLNLYVDNTLVASYDAEALKTFTESDLIDLGVLAIGRHDLAVEWTNDLRVEGTTTDSNIGLKDLVLYS